MNTEGRVQEICRYMDVYVSLQQVEVRGLVPPSPTSRPVEEEPLVVFGRNVAGPVSRDRDEHVLE
jgi:hypothetical protein